MQFMQPSSPRHFKYKSTVILQGEKKKKGIIVANANICLDFLDHTDMILLAVFAAL